VPPVHLDAGAAALCRADHLVRARRLDAPRPGARTAIPNFPRLLCVAGRYATLQAFTRCSSGFDVVCHQACCLVAWGLDAADRAVVRQSQRLRPRGVCCSRYVRGGCSGWFLVLVDVGLLAGSSTKCPNILVVRFRAREADLYSGAFEQSALPDLPTARYVGAVDETSRCGGAAHLYAASKVGA